jgi:hypothetical protein
MEVAVLKLMLMHLSCVYLLHTTLTENSVIVFWPLLNGNQSQFGAYG